ncbi:MAG TPA: glycerophosphodiester phosphodiesterase [Acidimicrobiales bacterium]|nr:glycerophosphodiester phosphodiesterase [Acidimicrobiales bacterium]
MSRRPIAFAHRGARAVRRENTIDAFQHALVLGATGLESDVWITADGQAVLDHDGVTGPPWRRRPLSAQERRALPSHIPTLEQLYGSCGTDFELSLDIKDPASLGETLRVAKAFDAAERLWICEPVIARLRSWAPLAGGARLVNSTHLDDMPEGFAVRLEELRAIGVGALNLHGSEWNSQRVAEAHDAGLLAFGWDAQDDRHIRRLVSLGLDGIYSDHVDRLVHAIATEG